MTDLVSLVEAVRISKPDEVYNLAAQSFVKTSWDTPVGTNKSSAKYEPSCPVIPVISALFI